MDAMGIEITYIKEKVDNIFDKIERRDDLCQAHQDRLTKAEAEIVRINDTVKPIREKVLELVFMIVGSALTGGGAAAAVMSFFQSHK